MMEPIAGLAGLAYFVAAVVATLRCARWTVGPLERAGTDSMARIRFAMADLLCLFAQVQLLLGALQALSGGYNISRVAVVAAILYSILAIAFWLVGALLLEGARVRNAWHRVFVLMVGIPVGVFGPFIASAIPVILLVGAVEGQWETFWLAPVVPVILGLLWGVRRMHQRIVAAAQRRNPE